MPDVQSALATMNRTTAIHSHMHMKSSAIRVGCAGWSIARGSSASFPQTGSHLQRYAGVFNAVEINSSFYRPHRSETYARWAASVPPDFRFSVKLPKEMTHALRLKACARPLKEFASQVEGLGSHLGCVLIQLPPSFAFDRVGVRQFLTLFRRAFATDAVVEPRHASWFEPGVDEFLHGFDVGRVGADPALCAVAAEPSRANAPAYFRLHGSPHMYFSTYDEATLQAMATRLSTTGTGAREAWCIFDNTAQGFATTNALRLVELLRERA